MKTKLLFLCSRNQWRSPTAEALLRGHARYEARSAGTENRARIKLTAGHVGWADMIFCIEKKHAARVRERFAGELGSKPLIVLRVSDDYRFMDAALVALLRSELSGHLDL
ncbi:low molecular weight protein tyrosine phosphatase family protein [Opitutus terrae]|uniref:Low molecular weight phosphotyrosine protein phosphatase n=1 Tax=Opitutus terrae (strain DSM 11246 / JCM 15787 / PB90-1) TaxID=452637 RepID=B1ZMK8_OPITP|nr:protein-tyrosine-phosphatase [Opitutus terrae]ACB74353.1 low molecular weight phosphotyrosine protein phosphatase [Opitutus terrae PB90-1]